MKKVINLIGNETVFIGSLIECQDYINLSVSGYFVIRDNI